MPTRVPTSSLWFPRLSAAHSPRPVLFGPGGRYSVPHGPPRRCRSTGCSIPTRPCAGRSNGTSPTRRPSSGGRPGRGWRPRGSGRDCWRAQDPDGQWAGGAYFPADFDFQGPEADGRAAVDGDHLDAEHAARWGLDAAALDGTAERLAANSRWEYDNLPYWGGEVDCCINAFTLANGAWLGADVGGIADWFLEHQLPDGGWNCEWVEGSARSSFHSTLNTLKGPAVTTSRDRRHRRTARRAARAGEEYLLERRLLYGCRPGESLGRGSTRFAYPFRFVYSALNAADYSVGFQPARRRRTRPPAGRRGRSDPRRPPARRDLATGTPPPRTCLVRGRRAARRTVQVAHLPRHPRFGVVGRCGDTSRKAAVDLPAGTRTSWMKHRTGRT